MEFRGLVKEGPGGGDPSEFDSGPFRRRHVNKRMKEISLFSAWNGINGGAFIQNRCHINLAILYFFDCMFYQLLRVQLHSCSSTQSLGSVLPSIVETRDQNSRGCPLLFSNRNLGSFCA